MSLAVIGRTWLTVADSAGNRRLDHENDYVALEIASALARNIAVIPVLVHDGHMPHSDQLPENLKDLAYRNSVELTHARWNSDVRLLVEALRAYVAPANPANTQPVHATVPAQLPPANAPAERRASVQPRRTELVAAAVVVVAALGIGSYFVLHKKAAGPVPAADPVVDARTVPQPRADSDAETAAVIGNWSFNRPRANNGLTRLEITQAGAQVAMHAWGNCSGPECDWNSCTSALKDGQLACEFRIQGTADGKLPARVANVTVKPEGGKLDVVVTNTFADRPPNRARFRFERAQ